MENIKQPKKKSPPEFFSLEKPGPESGPVGLSSCTNMARSTWLDIPAPWLANGECLMVVDLKAEVNQIESTYAAW